LSPVWLNLKVSHNEKLLDLYKFGQNRYLQCAVLVAKVEKNEEFTQKFYRGTNWKAEDTEGQHVYLGKITCADGRRWQLRQIWCCWRQTFTLCYSITGHIFFSPYVTALLNTPSQLMLQHYWTHLLLTLCYSTTEHTSAYVTALLDTPSSHLTLQHYWTHLLLSFGHSITGHTFFSAYVTALLDTPSSKLKSQHYWTHLLLTLFDKLSPRYYGSLRAYRQIFYSTPHRKY
jgi:hypothetical protein